RRVALAWTIPATSRLAACLARARPPELSRRFHRFDSGKAPIHLGQEPGEVEPARTCKTGGFEVSAGPVACCGGESGILAACKGAVAVVLVIGQESGEVPEFRLGSRRDRTASFAIGAHHRTGGDQDITKLMDVGSLDGLVAAGGIDVIANLVSVPHRPANATDPLVGPDRVEEALEWRQLSLLEHGHLLDHVIEDVSLGCITETMAGDLLHRDQADALFPAGVEGLVERRILTEPGMILEHDGIDNSPQGGRLEDLGPVLVMSRETDELRLARLAQGLRDVFQFLALDHVDRFVERVFVAEPVNEVEIDVIGAQGGEPLVNHREHLGGPAHHVLGDEKDLLANLGRLVEPLLEERLGTIDLGGIEDAHTAGVREPHDPAEAGTLDGPLLQHGHLYAGLAQSAPGDLNRLGRLLLRAGRGNRADRRRRGKRAGLKERTTIGTGRLMFRYRLRLLDEWKA